MRCITTIAQSAIKYIIVVLLFNLFNCFWDNTLWLQAILPLSSLLSDTPNNKIDLISRLIGSSVNINNLSTEYLYCPGRENSSFTFSPSHTKIGYIKSGL